MTRDEVGKQLVSQFTRLHTYAKFLCKDPDVAEELFQDTCLKVLENYDKYEDGTFFGAWSATVMRNIFINDVRWNSRYHFEDLTPVSARIDNSGDHLVHEEILETVRKLPPYLHEPITMYIDGFSYQEISDQLAIPMGTVKSRIFSARKILASELGEYV